MCLAALGSRGRTLKDVGFTAFCTAPRFGGLFCWFGTGTLPGSKAAFWKSCPSGSRFSLVLPLENPFARPHPVLKTSQLFTSALLPGAPCSVSSGKLE